MHHGLVREIEALVRPETYPLSSNYDPRWILGLDMGPHPLWQLEGLVADIDLQPGMRVLDLGSGRGATSVFLAREFGVEVVACDLWVPAEEAQAVFEAAGVADRVVSVNADVRMLPFSDEEFDAIISIDAFEYFGTDIYLLPVLLRVLNTGGTIGMSTPALRVDPYDEPVPAFIWDVFGHEVGAWHSPAWWQRHWELSEQLEDVHSRWQEGGRDDWLLWQRANLAYKGGDEDSEVIDILEQDVDELLGFTLISGRKREPGKTS
jgi:ubiquinone/menaquinone biosynthesis C-methylase UbiE